MPKSAPQLNEPDEEQDDNLAEHTGGFELDFFAVEVLDQEGDQYLTENELVIDNGCSKVHVSTPEFTPSWPSRRPTESG